MPESSGITPQSSPPNPDDFAVVVGIDHYPDFVCLRGTTNDAKDFASWLLDPLGGGLPEDNCKIVLSDDYPACPPRTAHMPEWKEPRRPIQADIDRAFKAISDRLREAEKGRRLYVYFSGHGLGRDALGADLCTAAWSKDFWRSAALDSEEYQKNLINSGAFREVVLLLDCCRVREVDARGLGPAFAWPMSSDRARKAGQARTFVGFATEFSNPAYEATVDEAGRPLVRGYFTRALLAALRGGAARAGGGVTSSDLKKYLERETPRLIPHGKPIQTPVIIDGLAAIEGQEPSFGQHPPWPSYYNVTFRADRRGPIVLEGPDAREIGRWDVFESSASGLRLNLSPGQIYVLHDPTAGDDMLLRVQTAGEEIDVEF